MNNDTATLTLEVFTQRNFVTDFIRLKLKFIQKKTKNRFLSHPLGTLVTDRRTDGRTDGGQNCDS